eukprot:TRINITY_DN45250_c0_g1_i1.p1 TRINITY_DN45250_c0_g1~~TRINITY_DN45250_c0_g1_i1.p1  ORF type:complete len:370 (+),score=27.22 TRINITY_DN45250_c0_g1_i1:171-1280(+)
MERCSSNMGDYSEEPPPAATRMATTLVKTRLCKHMSRGHCMFGEKCHFAHSQHEITARPNFQKTKLCLSFLRHGCSSSSCKYAHGPAELNPASSALLAAEVEARRREESAIDTSIGSASSYLFSAPVAHVINSSRRPSATASDAPDGVNSDFYPLLATLEQAATPPMASRGDAGATSIIPRSAWYRQEEANLHKGLRGNRWCRLPVPLAAPPSSPMTSSWQDRSPGRRRPMEARAKALRTARPVAEEAHRTGCRGICPRHHQNLMRLSASSRHGRPCVLPPTYIEDRRWFEMVWQVIRLLLSSNLAVWPPRDMTPCLCDSFSSKSPSCCMPKKRLRSSFVAKLICSQGLGRPMRRPPRLQVGRDWQEAS